MAHYVRRGAVAGVIAGCALAVFLLVIGERSLGQAVSLQSAGTVAETGSPPDQMFTRGSQLVGGALASILFGAGIGAIFGIAYAALRKVLPGADDWQRAMWLAVAGWAVVWAVPAVKYPPNPPGVGDPATITRRTLLWLTLVAWSLVSVWASVRLGRWLSARGFSSPGRRTSQLAAYGALVAVVGGVLPATGDPITPPANLVWHFRLASIGGQLLLWITLGAVFGMLSWRRACGSAPIASSPSMA